MLFNLPFLILKVGYAAIISFGFSFIWVAIVVNSKVCCRAVVYLPYFIFRYWAHQWRMLFHTLLMTALQRQKDFFNIVFFNSSGG